jgi:hypothetical protein
VALLIRRDSVDGGNQSFDRREIQQANTFAAPRVLKHVGNLWALAQADILDNADIWLCIEATATTFKLASSYREYYFPAHGLGADNDLLYLSATTPGLLTTTQPTTGQVRAILAAIVDSDHIFYAPSFRVEVV